MIYKSRVWDTGMFDDDLRWRLRGPKIVENDCIMLVIYVTEDDVGLVLTTEGLLWVRLYGFNVTVHRNGKKWRYE